MIIDAFFQTFTCYLLLLLPVLPVFPGLCSSKVSCNLLKLVTVLEILVLQE